MFRILALATSFFALFCGCEPRSFHSEVHDETSVTQESKIDAVLQETADSKGNVTSKFRLNPSEALDAGMKWVGPSFKEIGSGVFRSADGLRQFRIDKNSLAGRHAPGIPHVHFETYEAGANRFTANNHVPIDE